MNIRSLSLVLSVVALVGCGVFGCSSTTAASTAAAGNCPAVGSRACSKDDAVTQTEFDECTKSKADAKCGSAYVDVLKCAGANVTCGTDNKTDATKFEAACKTQATAYATCKGGGGGPDAGALPDAGELPDAAGFDAAVEPADAQPE